MVFLMSRNKIKLLTVIGARPQFMKASMLSKKINLSKDFYEILVHTGQHYNKSMSSTIISELFSRKPDYNLNSGGKDEINMTSYIIEKIKKLILKEKPNYVLVYGDTTTTLAASLSAKKLNIPLVHVEAGVRNYDLNMPEELNRVIVDRISDINFCATKQSLNNLKLEGYLKKTKKNFKVIFCGDLMFDCYNYSKNQIDNNHSLLNKYRDLIKKEYIYCTIHRQSNVDDKLSLTNIVKAVNQIHSKIPIIIPLHHRTRKRLKQFNLNLKCHVIESVSYFESLKLLKNCKFVMTDSGGLVREAFFAKKKSLSILEDIMWPEINNLNASISTGPNFKNIENKIFKLSKLKPNFGKKIFGNGDAAKKILTEIRLHFKGFDS